MKKLTQKILTGMNPEGESGDCFRTCVAMLLGLERDAVPNFTKYDIDTWEYELGRWLGVRDLACIVVDINSEKTQWPHGHHGTRSTCVILGCDSPRGNYGHSVVGRVSCGKDRILNIDVVHDPYPGGVGVVGINTIFYIVPRTIPPLPSRNLPA